MPELKLILIRHGETQWNVEGRLQGHLNSPLTPRGKEQAQQMADRLTGIAIDKIYSSDLGRCRDTVDILFSKPPCPIEYTDELRERNHGIFSGHTVAEIMQTYPDEYRQYKNMGAYYSIPYGESASARFSRIHNFYQKLVGVHSEGTLVIVTHGGGVDSMFRLTLGISEDYERNYKIPNLAYNEFRYCDGKWNMECWADTCHLGNSHILDDTKS